MVNGVANKSIWNMVSLSLCVLSYLRECAKGESFESDETNWIPVNRWIWRKAVIHYAAHVHSYEYNAQSARNDLRSEEKKRTELRFDNEHDMKLERERIRMTVKYRFVVVVDAQMLMLWLAGWNTHASRSLECHENCNRLEIVIDWDTHITCVSGQYISVDTKWRKYFKRKVVFFFFLNVGFMRKVNGRFLLVFPGVDFDLQQPTGKDHEWLIWCQSCIPSGVLSAFAVGVCFVLPCSSAFDWNDLDKVIIR